MLRQLTSQKGMSLIEAMVALVVISVGLLGIAALQIVALQQNSSSQWHSQAVWFSYEMSDRITANKSVFNDYDGIDTLESYAQDCQAGPCTANQMITADAQDWKRRIETLPSGQGLIESSANNELVIKVMWDDEGTGASGTECTDDKQTDLTCYTVTILN